MAGVAQQLSKKYSIKSLIIIDLIFNFIWNGLKKQSVLRGKFDYSGDGDPPGVVHKILMIQIIVPMYTSNLRFQR